MKTIIYVCPALSKPVGGIKVILRHSEILNRSVVPNLCSLIYIPDNLQHRFEWLRHEAIHKRDHRLDPSCDFVVLPEILAPRLGPRLAALGVRYAIFVQNGYLLFPEKVTHDGGLADVYSRAALVMSISRDTTACIERAFPHLRGRVLPMRYTVDPTLFHASETKQNAIAYMPRKLQDHARAVTGFLRAADLGGWEIMPIDNMTEAEVSAVLRRTRIFLSFSHLEGCPVPPLEAALAGNLVVGYPGEGGDEYWTPPLFTRIESGNIRQFVDRTLDVVRDLSCRNIDPITDPVHVAGRARLASTFSRQMEIDSVVTFAREAAALFEAVPAASAARPPVSLFSRRDIWRWELECARQRLEWFLVACTKTALEPLKWSLP